MKVWKVLNWVMFRFHVGFLGLTTLYYPYIHKIHSTILQTTPRCRKGSNLEKLDELGLVNDMICPDDDDDDDDLMA